TFSLHGLTYDHATGLVYARARLYHPKLARWMARDPKGYVDGGNLYEAFRGNPMRFTDPSGQGVMTWILVGDYDLSDIQFVRENTYRVVTTPVYGFYEGQFRFIEDASIGLGRTVGYTLGLTKNKGYAQQQLVNLVEAEYSAGGATPDETASVMVRAGAQGVVDFFGASAGATCVTGEDLVYGEGGDVYFREVSAYERVQAGAAAAGQFAGSVMVLDSATGIALSGARAAQVATRQATLQGLRLAARVDLPVPQSVQPWLRSFAFRLSMSEGAYQFGLRTPQAAANLGASWSLAGRRGLPATPFRRSGPRGVDPAHHNANVMFRDVNNNVLHHERLVSGSMTPEEAALGFPCNSLATHTEFRAVTRIPLEPGAKMTITGLRGPCPSCKGAMNRAVNGSGASIRYRWREGARTRYWYAGRR
ncbi:MAG: hypothetical protein JXB13_16090, partial [Phycisphaerae bacterium]|nr:hypothetical protein [Phycisphaerae bacterium]